MFIGSFGIFVKAFAGNEKTCTTTRIYVQLIWQYYLHNSLDNGNRALLIGFFATRISAHILRVENFKMAARSAEPTEAEVVDLLEKGTVHKT